MRKSSNIIWGSSFIILGILLLLDRVFNLHLASFETLWPLFVLIPGLIFESSYFLSENDPGLLVPGGILTIIGILFFFETYTGWRYSGYTWPVYPLSVAVGLFQLYLFGGRERGLLIPVTIIGGFSIVAIISMLMNTEIFAVLIPAALIILGVYIIFGIRKR